ncbi:hypothetical protein [Streptomyces gardneri]
MRTSCGFRRSGRAVLGDGTALPGGNVLYDAAEFSKALRDAGV